MSVRNQAPIPIWTDIGPPSFEKNSYSHGYRHVHYQMEPFTNTIDDQLMSSMLVNSDRFTNNHDGKHILFAGCSVTQASEINRDMGWAQKLYKKIKEKENLSGFYNIAIGGGSIGLQVSLIFKYVSLYGIPDVIFFNMPGSTRTFSNENSEYDIVNDELIRNGKIINSTVNITHEYRYPGSMLMAEFINFELYRALHEYCKLSKTKLISFSWADLPGGFDPGITQTLFDGKFDSFYPALTSKFIDFVKEYISNEENQSETLLIARDDVHPGDAEHAYYADFAFNIYEELNK